MISSVLRGGLANQLFQIATAVSLAIDNDDTYAFDFDSLVTMQGQKALTYKDNVYSKLSPLPKDWTSQFVITEENDPYKPIEYRKNLLLNGYWQCDKYFDNNRAFIVYLFSHDPTLSRLKEKYKDILTDSVSVHVRRGDYVGIGEALEQDYYFRALNHLWELEDVKNILIFSDDIEWCKENFLMHTHKIVYIEGQKDYEDLYLQSLCTHNIVGNSSFSWWGAYLNRNEMKRVYMPKPWTTSIGDDIYPANVNIIKSNQYAV